MRPGEKLYEELSTLLEDTVPTAHEKIRIFVATACPKATCSPGSNRCARSARPRDAGRLVVALKEIVLDYSPSAHLLKRVIGTRVAGSSPRSEAQRRNSRADPCSQSDLF